MRSMVERVPRALRHMASPLRQRDALPPPPMGEEWITQKLG